MRTLTYSVMNYHEFDKLVKEHFPTRKDFECVPAFEWNNYSSYTFENIGVPLTYKADTPPEMILKWQQSEIDSLEAWANNEKYTVVGPHQVLEGLFRKGVIPAGNYLIEVYW